MTNWIDKDFLNRVEKQYVEATKEKLKQFRYTTKFVERSERNSPIDHLGILLTGYKSLLKGEANLNRLVGKQQNEIKNLKLKNEKLENKLKTAHEHSERMYENWKRDRPKW